MKRPDGLLLLGTLTLVGCGGVRLAPVDGKVLFDGQPVTAASIYFMPDTTRSPDAKMAVAVLQLDGSFVMLTHPDGRGVIPGWYRVILSLGRRPEKELDKYRTVEKTPLEFQVPASGLRDVRIELQ